MPASMFLWGGEGNCLHTGWLRGRLHINVLCDVYTVWRPCVSTSVHRSFSPSVCVYLHVHAPALHAAHGIRQAAGGDAGGGRLLRLRLVQKGAHRLLVGEGGEGGEREERWSGGRSTGQRGGLESGRRERERGRERERERRQRRPRHSHLRPLYLLSLSVTASPLSLSLLTYVHQCLTIQPTTRVRRRSAGETERREREKKKAKSDATFLLFNFFSLYPFLSLVCVRKRLRQRRRISPECAVE